MPGQLLHQKSSFPSDVFMRHEAACTNPSAMQQTSPAAGTFKEPQNTAAAESDTQPQAAARRSSKPALLRDQHMPGELLHQKTAFPSDVFMRHEAAMQQLPSAEQSVKTSQQQQAALPVPQQTATARRSMSNTASSRPASPQATFDATSSVPASVAVVPAAVSMVLAPLPSDSIASEVASGSPVHGPVQSPRRGTSRLKQSSKRSPRTPRPAAEPGFKGTSHDLARSKTWATEWLAMGTQEEQAAANPQFAQLLQHSEGQHQSLHQQPVHQATLQHTNWESLLQSGHVSSHPPKMQSAEPSRQSQQLPGDLGSLFNAQATAAHRVDETSMTDEADVPDPEGRTPTNDEVQTRPWTAPDSLLKAATSPWVLDVRRLHSARPGSGGSPTARSEFLADSQAMWQKRKAHVAEVRQRRMQFQREKYEHQLQAAGFVVGLPANQKHRQWRLMWLHMVAAAQLRCACRAHVQQHKHQQEQRKTAAVKIAVWYKRLSATKQARQTLKAHRQLLPLSSLDKRREEEEKVAAASTIVCFMQDVQRGHSFVRAVQTFQLKVHRLQQLWRNTAAVRLHQRQLLFMQLQRFTERHAAKLVRTGAAFLSGATLTATSATATRKGTMAASCLRRSRPGSGKATMTGTTLPSSPRPAPAISEAIQWQVVDATLKGIRKQYFADLDSFWDARHIYRAQLQALQYRAQVLFLKTVDSLPGILPPMQPRFRLLQSSQQLKAMLVRCHEINEANNSLIQEQQAITVTAGNDAMGEDEQLQDTMLAAYWAVVNITRSGPRSALEYIDGLQNLSPAVPAAQGSVESNITSQFGKREHGETTESDIYAPNHISGVPLADLIPESLEVGFKQEDHMQPVLIDLIKAAMGAVQCDCDLQDTHSAIWLELGMDAILKLNNSPNEGDLLSRLKGSTHLVEVLGRGTCFHTGKAWLAILLVPVAHKLKCSDSLTLFCQVLYDRAVATCVTSLLPRIWQAIGKDLDLV
ncbi:hypothetical protein WJX77_001411 [Trebouxia sp. C0004]